LGHHSSPVLSAMSAAVPCSSVPRIRKSGPHLKGVPPGRGPPRNQQLQAAAGRPFPLAASPETAVALRRACFTLVVSVLRRACFTLVVSVLRRACYTLVVSILRRACYTLVVSILRRAEHRFPMESALDRFPRKPPASLAAPYRLPRSILPPRCRGELPRSSLWGGRPRCLPQEVGQGALPPPGGRPRCPASNSLTFTNHRLPRSSLQPPHRKPSSCSAALYSPRALQAHCTASWHSLLQPAAACCSLLQPAAACSPGQLGLHRLTEKRQASRV
jgi:hypothetical protein